MLEFCIMQIKTSLAILFLMCPIANAAESTTTYVSVCPEVIVCGTGDTSKQTYAAYLNNQKAYQCYYKYGDNEMSKIAGNAMTRCQTMYGTLNPTIRK